MMKLNLLRFFALLALVAPLNADKAHAKRDLKKHSDKDLKKDVDKAHAKRDLKKHKDKNLKKDADKAHAKRDLKKHKDENMKKDADKAHAKRDLKKQTEKILEKDISLTVEDASAVPELMFSEEMYDLMMEYYKMAEPENAHLVDQGDHRDLQIFAIPLAGSVSSFAWFIGMYFFLFGSISLPFAPSIAPSTTQAPTFFTAQPTKFSAQPSVSPLFLNAFTRTLLRIFELFNSFILSIADPPATPAPTVSFAPSTTPTVSHAPTTTNKPSQKPSIQPTLKPTITTKPSSKPSSKPSKAP